MNIKTTSKRGQSGLSIPEILIAVGIIAGLAGIIIPSINHIRSNSQEASVKSSISSLNSAVQVYLANGGKIDSGTDIREVLTKLKSVNAAILDAAGDDVAFSGPFIDLRVQVEPTDQGAAGLAWNQEAQRFVIDRSSNRFRYFLSTEPSTTTVEERTGSLLTYGDDWIWEYEEGGERESIQPTLVSLTPEAASPISDFDGPGVRIVAANQDVLNVASNSAVNPGFETNNGINNVFRYFGNPNTGPVAFQTDADNVLGWQTTASDNLIEVFQSGFLGIEAFSGEFFIEFNATEVSTLFQEVDVAGFEAVDISFAHGQRQRNTEQLRLLVNDSPPPQTQTPDQPDDLTGFTELLQTNTNRVGGFQLYQSSYDIPAEFADADTLFFAFQSVGEFSTRSVGNFLDEVSFRGVNSASLTGISVDIDAGNSISNVIQSARISLNAIDMQDTLTIAGDLSSRFTIEETFVGNNMTITITGEGFRHEFEEIFDQIRFETTSLSTEDRSVFISVNDGFAVSDPAEFVIEFE